MTPRLNSPHPLAVLVAAPLARMADLPLLPAVVAGSVYTQIVRGVIGDPFATLFPLIVAVSMYDWWYGRRQARINDTFKATVALTGLHQKIGAIGIVCFIRWLEYWSGSHLYQTGGLASVVIGLGIAFDEIASVDEKRVAAGARPLFLLAPVLATFRGALRRKLPPAPPAT